MTAGGGAVALGCAVDWATMSEMRRAQGWTPTEAALRVHNAAARLLPPRAYGGAEYDLVQLSRYNGLPPEDGEAGDGSVSRTFLAAGGVVWDVSSSAFFQPGSAYEIFAGRDATLALAHMRVEEADASCMKGWKDLDAGAQETLDSWLSYFDEKYRRVGVLREWVRGERLEDTEQRALAANRARAGVVSLPPDGGDSGGGGGGAGGVQCVF
jgi:predicted heme/steroid binding protein